MRSGCAGCFADGIGKKRRYYSIRKSRPLSALNAEVPTQGCDIEKGLRSCGASRLEWCTDELSAREGVDDDHRRTTVRTDEGRPNGTMRRISFLGLRVGHYVQQFSRPREVVLTFGIGDQPVVADAVKAAGALPHQKSE